MAEHLVICYNDLSDSDNWAVAKFLLNAAAKDPSVEVVWIIEPRQVALTYPPVDRATVKEVKKLLRKYLPQYFTYPTDEENDRAAQKLLVGDELQEEQIAPFKDKLSAEEFNLLQLAVSPKHGPREDAELHGQLGAVDFLTSLLEWGHGGSHQVSVAFDALDKIVNPVNLKTHSHEELVCRTPAEIEEFNRIVGEDLESRPECLRSWYMSCIREKQHQISSGGSKFGEFDVEDLLERVRSAESVTYFGGASLILLQRFLDSSVAGKIHCCIQAAAIDSKQSLFRNQFNLHLCMNAAKAVLPNHASFASFKVVPSDASNLVQYCYHDLATSGASGLPDATLTRQILTYNIRKDNALAIAKGEALLSRTVTGKMPDLTAFLCGFYPRFPGLRFVGHEVVIDDDDGLTFRKSMDNSGIPVAVIDNMVTLGRKEISSILSDLSLKECK